MAWGIHTLCQNIEKVHRGGGQGLSDLKVTSSLKGRNLFNLSEMKIKDTNEEKFPELKTNKQTNIKQNKNYPQQQRQPQRTLNVG